MDRNDVQTWVAGYELAWRTAGTEPLAGLFTDEATYRMSPWREPARGLAEIAALWEAERDGPDDQFTLATDVVAVDGEVAVVRAEVEYADPPRPWRDLWVLRFEDGRCREFEEWPFAPDQPDGHWVEPPGSGELVQQPGVDVVEEAAHGDRLGDERV